MTNNEFENFNEECWIIYGWKKDKWLHGILIYESKGGPGSVDFDWKKVVKRRRNIIGFNHTHPGGMSTPSSIDDNTMTGWVKALGKPLLCAIESNEQKIFLYERAEDRTVHYREIPFKKMGPVIRARIG